MSENEILVIKVKNESQIETVEKAVEIRVNTQEKNFEGYGVEQTKLIHAANIETRGRYVPTGSFKGCRPYRCGI